MENVRARLTVAAGLAGAAVIAIAPGSTTATLAYHLCFGFAIAMAWWGVASGGRSGRRAWGLVAAALTSWLVGDLLMALAPVEATVTPSDGFWLLGYPLLGAGVITMVRARTPHQQRAGLLDATALITAAAVAMWQLTIVPAIADATSAVQLTVTASYPLGDVALFAAVTFLVLSPGRRGMVAQLLVVALGLTLTADLGFALLPRIAPAVGDSDRLDGILLVANSLLAAASAHRDRAALTTPSTSHGADRLHPARIVFLGIALLTTPLIAVVRDGGTLQTRLILLAATTLVSVAVLARFAQAVRDQERIRRQLSFQATHDPLTGLTNRSELVRRLELALSGRRHDDRGLSLLYIDLDGFKEINDTWGHASGDAVLSEIGNRLRMTARASDVVARIGGDEFVVLCPDLDPAGAMELATRLLVVLSAPVSCDDTVLQVGASIGVASGDATTAEHPTSLLRAADLAMYQAKNAGRGRYAVASSNSVPPAPLAKAG